MTIKANIILAFITSSAAVFLAIMTIASITLIVNGPVDGMQMDTDEVILFMPATYFWAVLFFLGFVLSVLFTLKISKNIKRITQDVV